ncbi:MAG TPA: Gx transporter family protein [Bacillota bacterium]|nr:Gx transporter family protein [Bacillota bacterium]
MKNVRKMVYLAIIISLALVISYFEQFIPPLAPGAKPGLANIMTLVTISMFGFKEALVVTLIRSLLGAVMAGSPTGILFSMSGGILSTLIMSAMYLKLRRYFSIMGISTAGAVFHNIGQLMVASLVYGTFGIMFTYLPVLMISAIITGNFVGLVSRYIINLLVVKRALST